MTRLVQIQPPSTRTSTGFEQPFAMLEACHERVVRMLGLLDRLRTHLAAHGCDEQVRAAARDVLRYFDLAAPQHHLDEERHIFPLLLVRGDAAQHATVKRLQADHQAMVADWAAARTVLVALAEHRLDTLAPADAATLDGFAGRYAEHIRLEEGLVYPAALALCDAGQLADMGQEMAARRMAR